MCSCQTVVQNCSHSVMMGVSDIVSSAVTGKYDSQSKAESNEDVCPFI